MATYFYQGKFSPALKAHIFDHADNFEKIMKDSIEAFGGKLDKCFLTAASEDPIGFVEFDNNINARAWNAFYGSQQGVLSSTINLLLNYDDIKNICTKIGSCAAKATEHRKNRER